jgi:hypothetical protein
VALVAILFGLEEVRAEESVRLSAALGVPVDRFFDGVRFVPPADPAGHGSYVFDPDPEGADAPEPSDEERGDVG